MVERDLNIPSRGLIIEKRKVLKNHSSGLRSCDPKIEMGSFELGVSRYLPVGIRRIDNAG